MSAVDTAGGDGGCADESRCPRCGGAFHCSVQDEAPCWCASLTLTPRLLAELRGQYSSCLCPGCLRALAEEVPATT